MRGALGRVGRLVPILMLVGAAILSACGANPEPGEDGEPVPDRSDPVPLTVSNNYRLDVVVFVYHDGELTRVGTVTSASTATFTLAPWMLGVSRNIRLFGDPIGSNESARSELIYIQPGQTIDWRLESQLNRSTVSVF